MSHAIKWELCPEATHYLPKTDNQLGSFWRVDGHVPVCKWDCRGKFAANRGLYLMSEDAARLVERPVAEGWRGELPPIGTVCALSGPTDTLKPIHPEWEGREVKIYSHFVCDRGVKLAAYVSHDSQIGGVGVKELFVPIKTPEQLAAEARETAGIELAALLKALHAQTNTAYSDSTAAWVAGQLLDLGYHVAQEAKQ